ncbi:class I SAM-dependent methyltransferase [Candidatus Methylopumilus planktonicus]|uniref:class I SAM-dependent methyltransferase n=1 Tax=Candidatus Methylopumilus planktonicus TaxID=1581557 RepID=UPI003BEF1871
MNKKVSPAIAKKLAHAYDLFNQGLIKEAEDVAIQILKKTTDESYAFNLLGIIKLRESDLEPAIHALKKAADLNTNPELLSNLALAYQESGVLEKAMSFYEQALKIEPKYINALFNQHAIWLDRGHIDHATHNLQKILTLNPTDDEVIYLLLHLHHAYQNQSMAHYEDLLSKGNDLSRSRLKSFQYFKDIKPIPKLLGSGHTVLKKAYEAMSLQSGLILEFGVRHGTSIRQLASLISKPIYGFDSFEGLPENWYQESKEVYSTRGKIPKVPAHVTLIPGWFNQTLPLFLEKHEEDVALINIDCDIYSSTKTVLDLLSPRIKKGTIILFDEYIGNLHWEEDEHKAFMESIDTYQWKYEYLFYSAYTKQVVVRIC